MFRFILYGKLDGIFFNSFFFVHFNGVYSKNHQINIVNPTNIPVDFGLFSPPSSLGSVSSRRLPNLVLMKNQLAVFPSIWRVDTGRVDATTTKSPLHHEQFAVGPISVCVSLH